MRLKKESTMLRKTDADATLIGDLTKHLLHTDAHLSAGLLNRVPTTRRVHVTMNDVLLAGDATIAPLPLRELIDRDDDIARAMRPMAAEAGAIAAAYRLADAHGRGSLAMTVPKHLADLTQQQHAQKQSA